MNIIPYNLLQRRLMVVFALPLFYSIVFQPAPPTIAAAVEPCVPVAQDRTTVQIPITVGWVWRKSETKILAKIGPVFPAVFSMNSFKVYGFVKGRWPIVIDYELEPDSTAELMIGTKHRELTRPIQLESTNGQRRQLQTVLPEGFGEKPQVGVLSFDAHKTGPGPRRPARFFLYGLGVGDKAVGSMVIDQLVFQPGSIHPKLKQKATYSFRSLSDLDAASVNFMLVTLSPDGVVRPQLVASETLENGVRRGDSVKKDWDGKNSKGKISLGPHQFHVRAWRGSKSGADWVFAATQQVVRVE
jgi:hypothetical protein